MQPTALTLQLIFQGVLCFEALRTMECTQDFEPDRRRYYSDRQNYKLLDEYSVADGCEESEIMQQISCDVQGDYLFSHMLHPSGDKRENISCSTLIYPNHASNPFLLLISHVPSLLCQLAQPTRSRRRRQRRRREERFRHLIPDSPALGAAPVRHCCSS